MDLIDGFFGPARGASGSGRRRRVGEPRWRDRARHRRTAAQPDAPTAVPGADHSKQLEAATLLNMHPHNAQAMAVASIDDVPAVALIGPIHDRRQARDWALVLQSQSIGYVLRPDHTGWALQVPIADEQRAWASIELFEEENKDWPPKEDGDAPRHAASVALPAAFLLLAWFFLSATGPVASGSIWFRQGRADNFLLESEPWRMLTALTLHADAGHVLGNIISGSIFSAAVSRRFGPGGALFAVILGGTLGNLVNGLYHLPDAHRSIGASTAVFAAVGILAGVQTILLVTRKRRIGFTSLLGPLIGGLAILGTLGASPTSDLGAHGFGFAVGVVIGVVGGWLVRDRDAKPSNLIQWGFGLTALGTVFGSWALAMRLYW